MKPSMKVKSIGTCIALLLFGVGAIYGTPLALPLFNMEDLSHVKNMPFDAETWKSQPVNRLAMAHDLCQKKALEGLSKAEVIKLLGAADARSLYLQNKKALCYNLIQARKGTSSILVITMKDNKVVDTSIEYDDQYSDFHGEPYPYYDK